MSGLSPWRELACTWGNNVIRIRVARQYGRIALVRGYMHPDTGEWCEVKAGRVRLDKPDLRALAALLAELADALDKPRRRGT